MCRNRVSLVDSHNIPHSLIKHEASGRASPAEKRRERS